MVGGKAIGPVFTEFVCVFTVQASGLFCCINCLLDDTVMLCTNVCDHGSFRFSNAMLYPTTLTYVAWPVPHDACALYLNTMENGDCKVCKNVGATSTPNMSKHLKAEITHCMQTTKL